MRGQFRYAVDGLGSAVAQLETLGHMPIIMNKPDFNEQDVRRAIDLMKAAGWIEKHDDVPPFTGLKMTPEGQKKAQILLNGFRELGCPPDRDLRSVLGVISWYLNNDDMN